MLLDSYCNGNIATAVPETSLAEAARIMRIFNVGQLVVLDDEASSRPVGMVRDRDIVVSVVADGMDPDNTYVRDVMSKGVTPVTESTTFWQALGLVRGQGALRLPVVDDDGRFRGVFDWERGIEAVSTSLVDLEIVDSAIVDNRRRKLKWSPKTTATSADRLRTEFAISAAMVTPLYEKHHFWLEHVGIDDPLGRLVLLSEIGFIEITLNTSVLDGPPHITCRLGAGPMRLPCWNQVSLFEYANHTSVGYERDDRSLKEPGGVARRVERIVDDLQHHAEDFLKGDIARLLEVISVARVRSLEHMAERFGSEDMSDRPEHIKRITEHVYQQAVEVNEKWRDMHELYKESADALWS